MATEKRLIAYIDGTLAGEFGMSPSGSVSFRYDEGYTDDPNGVALSLSHERGWV